MATCTSCGSDVTGKKFCQQCGTPVQPTGTPAASPSMSTCPRCNGEVKPGAAFCMHCGSSLSAQAQPAVPTAAPVASVAPVAPAVSQPLTRPCPSCHTEIPVGTVFCTNCGQNMNASAPATAGYCPGCGHQNAAGVSFCASCGRQLNAPAAQAVTGPYTQQPQTYSQPQYTQYPPQQPQYGQPQYHQPQPMLGQPPMVLRCPVCMAMAPMGTANCVSCHTSLAGVVPTPANMPAQGQQGGLGGFMQGDGGKYAMGALGGAAAVVGGEMLLNNLEHHHHHQNYDDDNGGGMLGGLGDIANDVGLL